MFEMTVVRNNPGVKRCQIGVVVKNNAGAAVGACYSDLVNLDEDAHIMRINMSVPNHQLAKGKYTLNFNISNFDYSAAVRDFDIVSDVISFEVMYIDKHPQRHFVVWPGLGSSAYRNAEVTIQELP